MADSLLMPILEEPWHMFEVVWQYGKNNGNEKSFKTEKENVESRQQKLIRQHLHTYSMAEVSDHCDMTSCWIVLWDKVYDVTKFIREHPGGEDIILENAGRDCTIPFKDVGHSKDSLTMLEKFCIGMLTETERIFKRTRYDTC